MEAKNLTPGPKDVIATREYTLRDLTQAANILIIDTHLAGATVAMKNDYTLDDSKPFFVVKKEDAVIEFIHADFTQKVTLILDREDGAGCRFKDVLGVEHDLQFFKGNDLEFEDIQPQDHPPFSLQLVDLLVEIAAKGLHMRMGNQPGIYRDAALHGNETNNGANQVVFTLGVYSEGVLTQPDHFTAAPTLVTCDILQVIGARSQDLERSWHSTAVTDINGASWVLYWKNPH